MRRIFVWRTVNQPCRFFLPFASEAPAHKPSRAEPSCLIKLGRPRPWVLSTIAGFTRPMLLAAPAGDAPAALPRDAKVRRASSTRRQGRRPLHGSRPHLPQSALKIGLPPAQEKPVSLHHPLKSSRRNRANAAAAPPLDSLLTPVPCQIPGTVDLRLKGKIRVSPPPKSAILRISSHLKQD
jgi:hypothetical protein